MMMMMMIATTQIVTIRTVFVIVKEKEPTCGQGLGFGGYTLGRCVLSSGFKV